MDWAYRHRQYRFFGSFELRLATVTLRLAPEILEEVIEHAKAAHPLEGCGFIVGSVSLEGERFIPMENVLASATAYQMDPAQLINTLKDLRDRGENVVAIYHSHPSGPARPSQSDVDRAYYPEAAHLIVSLAEPEHPRVAAFRISGQESFEIDLRVIV